MVITTLSKGLLTSAYCTGHLTHSVTPMQLGTLRLIQTRDEGCLQRSTVRL